MGETERENDPTAFERASHLKLISPNIEDNTKEDFRGEETEEIAPGDGVISSNGIQDELQKEL